jgi:hypothetical protein
MSIAKKLPPNEKAKRKTHTPPKAMKLPDEEALLLIRDVHSKNLDIKQAAVKYGVSVTTAYNLMNGVNRGYLLRSVEEINLSISTRKREAKMSNEVEVTINKNELKDLCSLAIGNLKFWKRDETSKVLTGLLDRKNEEISNWNMSFLGFFFPKKKIEDVDHVNLNDCWEEEWMLYDIKEKYSKDLESWCKILHCCSDDSLEEEFKMSVKTFYRIKFMANYTSI